jgi:hypothetical protein
MVMAAKLETVYAKGERGRDKMYNDSLLGPIAIVYVKSGRFAHPAQGSVAQPTE